MGAGTLHAAFTGAAAFYPNKEIYFAKDSKAGGSWFAADNCGNIAMLFNGAFVKHEKKPVCKKPGDGVARTVCSNRYEKNILKLRSWMMWSLFLLFYLKKEYYTG